MSQYLTELRCTESIAREAGKRIESERRAGFSISLKGKNDLVTNVDRSIETFIRAQLHALFPGDYVVGEEHGEDGPSEAKTTRTWFVDPIDGTLNFATGVPLYCVSIALQIDGQTCVGVIYEPSRDELFSARLGHGAWLNGQPIEVSEQPALCDAVLVTGFPAQRTEEFDRTLEQFATLTRESRGVRRLGSAAIDLAYVASGRLDGFWEYGLNAWDTAAGYLMVNEAGGLVTDLSGSPYTAHEPSMLATNTKIHEAMLRILTPSA
ncbi:MAG: inositol monophosphatase [Bradymonadaceae bacterium]|nr:inositol monophosphatase [Lujinxingiaceae bacterium]